MLADIIDAYSKIVPCKSCPFMEDCQISELPCKDYLKTLYGELPRQADWRKLKSSKYSEYPYLYECGRCKNSYHRKTNFCPNCGARMKDE